MDYKNLSFNASLEGAKSYKDFFLSLDCFMPLEWKVDFTLLQQLFCCGASPHCELPKLGSVIKTDDFEIELAEKSLDFARTYFHHITTLDDMLSLKKNSPKLFEFYKENSSTLYVSSLNNANLVRQIDFLTDEFSFRGIDDIKISGFYARNKEIIKKVKKAIELAHEKVGIYAATFTMPEDDLCSRELDKLAAWTEKNGIETHIMSEEELRVQEDVQLHESVFEYWEEHTLYMVKNNFFFNKHDSLHNDNAFWTTTLEVDPAKFLFSMLDKKVKVYRNNAQHMPESNQRKYYEWVANNIKVNEDYTFIPSVLLRENQFYNELVNHKAFMKTPLGLLKSGAQGVVPVVSFA